MLFSLEDQTLYLKELCLLLAELLLMLFSCPRHSKDPADIFLVLKKIDYPGYIVSKRKGLAFSTEELIKKSQKLKEENIKRVNSYYDRTRKSIGEAAGLTVDASISDKKA